MSDSATEKKTGPRATENVRSSTKGSEVEAQNKPGALERLQNRASQTPRLIRTAVNETLRFLEGQDDLIELLADELSPVLQRFRGKAPTPLIPSSSQATEKSTPS